MNKVKLVVVAAVLAAPMTAAAVDTAEAGPRLSRLFRVAHTLRVMRHTQPRVHVYRRDTTYRETTYREPSRSQETRQRREATTAPRKTAQHDPSPNAVGIRQTDARGRVYDPGSMVWFDGAKQCWTGTQPWSFKNNAWYYGSARWYPTNGGWQTDTADPPAPVGCQTVPTFAAVTPPPQEVVRYDASDSPAAPEKVVETKSVRPPTASPVVDRPANCTKYLAVIGRDGVGALRRLDLRWCGPLRAAAAHPCGKAAGRIVHRTFRREHPNGDDAQLTPSNLSRRPALSLCLA